MAKSQREGKKQIDLTREKTASPTTPVGQRVAALRFFFTVNQPGMAFMRV
jgi:hypothetical protein